MTLGLDSQSLESFVPVYDALPPNWEDARGFLAEQLKQVANNVNNRVIGFYLDTELLSGKSFIPGVNTQGNGAQNIYRDILRMVVNLGALVPGTNPGVNHGVTFDANFTLIDLWVCGTNTSTFQAQRISGNDVTMNATQIVVNSPGTFNKAFAFIEYCQQP